MHEPIRTATGLFVKGQTGNPGGRPKGDVATLARQHTMAAIEALVAALNCPKERVAAAEALLKRGWGMPVQHVQQLDEDGNPTAAVAPAMVVRVEYVGEAPPPRAEQQSSRPALTSDVRRNVTLVG